jgi:hypothetical protein
MKRTYWDTRTKTWPACQECEHCDGSNSSFVRNDPLRGLVCPQCDKILDQWEMESDGDNVRCVSKIRHRHQP